MAGQFIDIKLNNKKISDNVEKLILDTESAYRGQLFKVADTILEKDNIQVVLLAGPSCAGKTTSANLLKECFEKRGKDVVTISMDDFFIDRDKTPFLPNGLRDLDSPNSVDIAHMEECFRSFFAGVTTTFPIYDFKTGTSAHTSFKLTKKQNTIVIFEGLHTLNPVLYKHLGTENYFKIYVNSLTGFCTDDCIMSARELRLLRRMIRDVDRRDLSPQTTLKNWSAVCDAEDKYITPFANNADIFIDTTHDFELGIYKEAFENLIKRGKVTPAEYVKYDVLSASNEVDRAYLPKSSLMWEFVDPPKTHKKPKLAQPKPRKSLRNDTPKQSKKQN